MATRRKAPFFLLRFFIFTFLASLTLIEPAPAQVVTDGTLGGEAGPVGAGTVPGVGTTTYHITDSLGKRAGQNLFHSFSSFNVWAGESATFTSASNGIRKVVSRVTGGSYSTIDGTHRSTIQGARASALQAAQLALLKDPRYDHPCYWAPFLLINNWL